MQESILVILETDVLKAQRVARRVAMDAGFAEAEAEEAAIIASELASNLLKHRTVNGEIIIRNVSEAERDGIEIHSKDTGPGMADVETAMTRSTAGTLGIGLSGVRRMSDVFTIDSAPGEGTTVSAKKWLNHRTERGMNFSVLSRPKPGEEVNGDSWFIKHLPSAVFFGVIDALGHGRDAYLTSLTALDLVEENYREPLGRFIERCHAGLRGTRGVAMSVCHIDYLSRKMLHVGLGNVETRIYCTSSTVRPYCYNGTLGMRMEKYRINEFHYEPDETVIMFSDGISGQFENAGFDLCGRPQVVASAIFRDFTREYDDATVLVGK